MSARRLLSSVRLTPGAGVLAAIVLVGVVFGASRSTYLTAVNLTDTAGARRCWRSWRSA